MKLDRLQVGSRVPAKHMNSLIDMHNEYYENDTTDLTTAKGAPNLWGICNETAPVFSFIEVYSTASGVTSDEAPVVSVRKPSTILPLGLFTNGEVSGTKLNLLPLHVGQPFKIDVVTGDTFVIGAACGPKVSSFQCTSKGVGFVCLSQPVTYQSMRKYIWAAPCIRDSGLVHFKAGGSGISGFTPGTLTLGNALCRKYNLSGGGVLSDSGEDVMIWNAAGPVNADAWGVAKLNEAGLLEVIVERCLTAGA